MFSLRPLILKAYMSIAILTSGYALTTTKYSSIIYLLCLAGLVLFFVQISVQNNGVKTGKFLIALLLLAAMLLPAIASVMINTNKEDVVSLFKLVLAITFGAVLFLSFDFRSFQSAFSNMMLAICAISLPGYMLANFTDLLSKLPVIINVNEVGYRFALIFISFDGFMQYRNVGVFWEPGIFSTMIFCALVADLYSENKASMVRTSIFLVALATAFAGSGLILFAIYMALVLSKPAKQGSNNLYGRTLPIVAVILAAYAGASFVVDAQLDAYSFLERLTGKITNPGETQSERFLSPFVSLQVFIEKPIVGWGLHSALEEYGELSNGIVLTSTSAYLMAAIGISGVLFTLIPVLGIAMAGSLSLFARILLIFSYLFITNKEPHVYFTLTYALMFFSLAALSDSSPHSKRGVYGAAPFREEPASGPRGP
jgi:hypothetical protein